jgi:hypothetical protein
MLQGLNNWVSGNVKQTPHDPNMVWASNQYLIVFQVFYQFFRCCYIGNIDAHNVNTLQDMYVT